VFYCNLPIGVLSLFFVWRFVPHIRHMQHAGKMRLDWPGALLISLSLGSLQLLVELLPKRGITGGMLLLLALSVVAFYALWKWEQRAAQPILP
jgi:hypothetical protein